MENQVTATSDDVMSENESKKRRQSSWSYQRSTPSPLPLMSISSVSSSSTSVAARPQPHQPPLSRGVIAQKINGPVVSSATSSLPQKRVYKKTKNKWLCSHCHGDVRLPPPDQHDSEESSTKNTACFDENTSQIDHIDHASAQEIVTIKEFLQSTAIMCSSPDCSFPRFHLSCSRIPICSKIFRRALLASNRKNDNQNPTRQSQSSIDSIETDSKYNQFTNAQLDVRERLYSHSEGLVKKFFPFCNGDCEDLSGADQPKSKRNKDPLRSYAFLCPNCDVEGTSRYLLEYFEQFQSMKQSFYRDYLQKNGGDANEGERRDSVDECVEARTGTAFLQFLTKHHGEENLQQKEGKWRLKSKKHTKSTINQDDEDVLLDNLKPSEIRLDRIRNVLETVCENHKQITPAVAKSDIVNQCIATDLDPSYLVGRPLRLFNPIDSSYQTGRIIDSRRNAPYKVDDVCSIKSPGRRRKRDREKSCKRSMMHLVDDNICKTLYLVRFRDGMEGRKIAVHQWIYLEEHAVTVGGEICWAKVGEEQKMENCPTTDVEEERIDLDGEPGELEQKKCKNSGEDDEFVSLYRPIQMVFRSSLEMIPVQDLNPEGVQLQSSPLKTKSEQATKCSEEDDNKLPESMVFAVGFGQSFRHIRLSLDKKYFEEASATETPNHNSKRMPPAKKVIHENSKPADPSTTRTLTEAKTKLLIPKNCPSFFPMETCIPEWLDHILHRARLYDHDLALATAMALMEKEETKRVRKWKKLRLSYLPSVDDGASKTLLSK